MKKILVTGGFGFVGGRLTKDLTGDHEVLVSTRSIVDDSVLALHGNPAQILHDNLLEPEGFPEGIETVIHLAALNEKDAVLQPSLAIKVNIDQTRIVLENAIKRQVKRFIYFSTAHVYGSPLQGKITETTIPVPVHPYSITHKAAEDYVIASGVNSSVLPLVLRLSNSFGAPVQASVNRWTLLANDLCRQAIEKRSLTLLSNGCQFRDFICLTDVVSAIRQILDSESGIPMQGIYNLGSGTSLQVNEIAALIADIYKEVFNEILPIFHPSGTKPTEEPGLVYSIDKLQNSGITINNLMKEELRNLLSFCLNNFKYDA